MQQAVHFQASHDPASSLAAAELEPSSEGSRWRQHLQILLPILAVYLSLAFYGIDRQSLWEDEYNSLWRVTVSPNPIWKDGHGFLYFALLDLWVQAGTSEFVLRSLSVFLGAAAVCLIYTMGSALLDQRAAVMGTALFATSPFLIWYSQEVRYITLVLATTLLAMHAFHRALIQHRFAWWFAYSGANLLVFFSFLATLLLPVIQGLYLLSSSSRHLLKKWVVCQVLIFVVFALWFVNGTLYFKSFMEATTSSQQTFVNNRKLLPFSGDFNQVRAAVIPYTFFVFSTGFSLGPAPRELYADRSLAPLVPHIPLLLFLAVLYGGLLLSGWLALRRQRDSVMFLALWVTVPILGVFGIAKLLNIFYDVRYVAMAFPAYVLFLAAGIVRFRKLGVQMLLFGVVLAVHGAALANYYFNPQYAREDTRAAGQLLESAVRPGDVLLVVGTSSSLPHYYKGNVPLVDFGSLDRAGQPLAELLREVSAKRARIWLVQIRPWQIDRAGEVKAALDAAHNLFEQQHFSGVDVYGYKISE
jgi:4-amino-4-deoxy-L-arabinose transferase-like glycosyltransferase